MTHADAPGTGSPLCVMSYNVLFGCPEESRFSKFLEIIRAAAPDVLVLQECVGWDSSGQLARVADALGGAHAELGAASLRGKRRMDVALVSRLPLARFEAHANDHVAHVLVDATFEWSGSPVRLLGAHFTASEQRYRMREARWIVHALLGGSLAARNVLLAGDLNSLSPRDPYDARFLRAPGTRKFGEPVSFEVLELLETAGFVDTLHARGRPERWITAPRAYADIREDFVLASPPLAARLERAWVGEHDAHVSDHIPVLARFR